MGRKFFVFLMRCSSLTTNNLNKMQTSSVGGVVDLCDEDLSIRDPIGGGFGTSWSVTCDGAEVFCSSGILKIFPSYKGGDPVFARNKDEGITVQISTGGEPKPRPPSAEGEVRAVSYLFWVIYSVFSGQQRS